MSFKAISFGFNFSYPANVLKKNHSFGLTINKAAEPGFEPNFQVEIVPFNFRLKIVLIMAKCRKIRRFIVLLCYFREITSPLPTQF
jgi:hypothetical protein